MNSSPLSVTQAKLISEPVNSLPANKVAQLELDGDGEDDTENHGDFGTASEAASTWAEIGRSDITGPFSATQALSVLQAKSVTQLAHSANAAGTPKNYTTSAGQAVTGVQYDRVAKGYIDFTQAPVSVTHPAGWQPNTNHDNTDISDPANPNKLNLVYPNGTVPDLTNSTRAQHFKVANTVAFHGADTSSNSPAGYTWHHKDTKGRMVLVDRTVHQKHGHNGGFHIWT